MMPSYANRPRDARGRIGPEAEGIEFTPPEGLELRGPSGTSEVKWRRKPDGTVCIVSMDGVTLGDGDESPENPDTDEGGDAESAQSSYDTDQ